MPRDAALADRQPDARLRTPRAPLALCLLALASGAAAQDAPRYGGPIIDVHLHGGPASQDPSRQGPSDSADAAVLEAALRRLDEHRVVLALTSIAEAERFAPMWRAAAPGRLLVGPLVSWNTGWPDTTWLRTELAAGRVALIGEMNLVHLGVPPSDPRADAIFRLAHEFDVPVSFHVGRRRPDISPPGCCTDADHANGNPDLLRPILDRYPGLRLYLLHVGGRYFTDESLALMRDYPQVHADMSMVSLLAPREVFHANLRSIIDQGLIGRILFGSDGSSLLRDHIEAYEAVPFLTAEHKRGIFHDNAARFLRLDRAPEPRP